MAGRPADAADIRVHPDQPGHRLCAVDRDVEIHRRGPHVHRLPRRARRRRLPEDLDQSRVARRDDPDVRPGRDRVGQRRRDLGLLVQPADGAVLPRDRRQRVSLPRLRRAAGERVGLRGEPRRSWADHVPRVASGRRRGIRLRRAGSAGSRTSCTAASSRASTVAPARRSRWRPPRDAHYARPPHRAGAVFAGRSAHAVLRDQPAVEDRQRRVDLDADQSRPVAGNVGAAGDRRRVPDGTDRAAGPARRRSTPSRRRRSTRT